MYLCGHICVCMRPWNGKTDCCLRLFHTHRLEDSSRRQLRVRRAAAGHPASLRTAADKSRIHGTRIACHRKRRTCRFLSWAKRRTPRGLRNRLTWGRWALMPSTRTCVGSKLIWAAALDRRHMEPEICILIAQVPCR